MEQWRATGAPALAIWALNSSGPIKNRTAVLRLVSTSFDRKSQAKVIVASRLLPLILLIGIGGVFVLIYSLMLFLPLVTLYEGLA